MDSDNSQDNPPPLPQTAQICAWCGAYLMADQETVIYGGNDPCFTNWVVHEACEKLFNK